MPSQVFQSISIPEYSPASIAAPPPTISSSSAPHASQPRLRAPSHSVPQPAAQSSAHPAPSPFRAPTQTNRISQGKAEVSFQAPAPGSQSAQPAQTQSVPS